MSDELFKALVHLAKKCKWADACYTEGVYAMSNHLHNRLNQSKHFKWAKSYCGKENSQTPTYDTESKLREEIERIANDLNGFDMGNLVLKGPGKYESYWIKPEMDKVLDLLSREHGIVVSVVAPVERAPAPVARPAPAAPAPAFGAPASVTPAVGVQYGPQTPAQKNREDEAMRLVDAEEKDIRVSANTYKIIKARRQIVHKYSAQEIKEMLTTYQEMKQELSNLTGFDCVNGYEFYAYAFEATKDFYGDRSSYLGGLIEDSLVEGFRSVESQVELQRCALITLSRVLNENNFADNLLGKLKTSNISQDSKVMTFAEKLVTLAKMQDLGVAPIHQEQGVAPANLGQLHQERPSSWVTTSTVLAAVGAVVAIIFAYAKSIF